MILQTEFFLTQIHVGREKNSPLKIMITNKLHWNIARSRSLCTKTNVKRAIPIGVAGSLVIRVLCQ